MLKCSKALVFLKKIIEIHYVFDVTMLTFSISVVCFDVFMLKCSKSLVFLDRDVAICVRGATDFQNSEDLPHETAFF